MSSSKEKINLLIVDDHPLVSDGIRMMLQDVDYIAITATARNGKEALEILQGEEVTILLLDISLPDINGLELCTQIRKQYPSIYILGLTSTNEAGIISSFLKNGGNGYLLKNMERNELIEAIDSVLNNKVYLSKAANEKILEQFQNIQKAMDSVPLLTRREKEILQLVNEGLSSPQIAERLYLSQFTIETHRKNLMQKIGVNNTASLLKKARDLQLLS